MRAFHVFSQLMFRRMFLFSLFFMNGLVSAETNNINHPVHIHADKMVASPQKRYMKFQGHVRVTQEGIQLNADELNVYLISSENSVAITKESIKKINAVGNVHIHWNAYKIDADTAIYLPLENKMLVSGNMARIYQGKNMIAGSRIILNLSTDQIEISSKKGEQVEAFYEFSDQDMKNFQMQKSDP